MAQVSTPIPLDPPEAYSKQDISKQVHPFLRSLARTRLTCYFLFTIFQDDRGDERTSVSYPIHQDQVSGRYAEGRYYRDKRRDARCEQPDQSAMGGQRSEGE
jgi:hypothetical protein